MIPPTKSDGGARSCDWVNQKGVNDRIYSTEWYCSIRSVVEVVPPKSCVFVPTLGLTEYYFSFFIFHSPQRTTIPFHFSSVCHSSNAMVATQSRMRAWTLAVVSIALCATRLAAASASNVALSEEKFQMSNAGNLRYESLSDDEKLRLFQQYISDCQRTVRHCDDVLEQYAQSMWRLICNPHV